MLEYLITSKAKRSLLKLLVMNPGRAFYTREIVRMTGEPINAVRRELGYLEQAGLVSSHREGVLKFHQLNKHFPFYTEIRNLIYGTVGLGDYLSGGLRENPGIGMALVFGSVASDEETAKSDIDLLVVGEIGEDALHGFLSKAEQDIHRPLNYVLMRPAEFRERLRRDEPFTRRVMAEPKIILKGNPDDY